MTFASQSHYNVLIPLKTGNTLAYNTKTQVFALWNKQDIDIYNLVGKEKVDIKDLRLNAFIRAGYIVEEGVDERAAIKKEYDQRRNNSSSLSLTILPTVSCNFGCDYCTQGADKPQIKMSLEVQDAIINMIEAKAPHLSYLNVTWFGGEPLLQSKMVTTLSDRILEICQRYNIGYSALMISNGWFLTSELAQQLHDRKVNSIQVTLDGSGEFHDQRRHLLGGNPTFERLISNIRAVVENTPMRITIRVNIDERNRVGIYKLMDRLIAEGLNGRRNLGIYFAPVESRTEECHGVCESTMKKKEYGDFEVELLNYAYEHKLTSLPGIIKFHGLCCALKPQNMVILPNGDLHKCWDTVGEPHRKVGTIFNLPGFATNPLHQQWNEWSPFKEKTCSTCKLLPSCTGACAQKYLYPENLKGEAALPCPSWKYSLNERLFLRAEKKGLVSREKDWCEEVSVTNPNVLKIPQLPKSDQSEKQLTTVS